MLNDTVPGNDLDSNINLLKQTVAGDVLGKRKLKDDDLVTINDGKEMECDLLDKLRSGVWFNARTIDAAMAISDPHPFVKYSYSIPLDEIEEDGKLQPYRRPLQRWRKEIESASGQDNQVVYLSPLNHGNNHFSLLEININGTDRKILHYDSMARDDVVNGTVVIDGAMPLTRVGKLVKDEFGGDFDYLEAPTPQQTDASSCGAMVVRNAALRMQGLPVGGWTDQMDGDRLRMDIAGRLRLCAEDGAMRKGGKIEARKSKRLRSG